MNIIERKKALEAVLRQKMNQLQSIDAQKNSVVTEIVQIQGKLELLNELEKESFDKSSEVEKEEKRGVLS